MKHTLLITLALLPAALPAAPTARDSVAYKATAHVSYGSFNHDIENTQVEVLDYGDGTYTFTYRDVNLGFEPVGDYRAEGVSGVRGDDGSVSYSFNGNARIYNLGDTPRDMLGWEEGHETPLTIEGNSRDGKLYAIFKTTYRNIPATITFGENLAPSDTTTYTAPLRTEHEGSYYGQNDATLTVIGQGNDYQMQVKGLRSGYDDIGDVTITGIAGTRGSDGTVSYSYEGDAVLTNLGYSASAYYHWQEGQRVAIKLEGESRDGVMHATVTTSATGEAAKLIFNPQPPIGSHGDVETAATYGGTMVSTWWYSETADSAARISIDRYADGTTGLTLRNVSWSEGRVGDIVIPTLYVGDGSRAAIATTGTAYVVVTDEKSSYKGKELAVNIDGTIDSSKGELTVASQVFCPGDNDFYLKLNFTGSSVADGIALPDSQPTRQSAPTYNLAGQRVGNDYHGLAISQGKKVVK